MYSTYKQSWSLAKTTTTITLPVWYRHCRNLSRLHIYLASCRKTMTSSVPSFGSDLHLTDTNMNIILLRALKLVIWSIENFVNTLLILKLLRIFSYKQTLLCPEHVICNFSCNLSHETVDVVYPLNYTPSIWMCSDPLLWHYLCLPMTVITQAINYWKQRVRGTSELTAPAFHQNTTLGKLEEGNLYSDQY